MRKKEEAPGKPGASFIFPLALEQSTSNPSSRVMGVPEAWAIDNLATTLDQVFRSPPCPEVPKDPLEETQKSKAIPE